MKNQFRSLCRRRFYMLLILFLQFAFFTNAQPQIIKVQYGGQITGTIIFSKDLLSKTNYNEEGMLNFLRQNITTYRYLNTSIGEGLAVTPALSNRKIEKINITSQVELIKTTDENYFIKYSIGKVSNQPIISPIGTVTHLNPNVAYKVDISEMDTNDNLLRLDFASDFQIASGLNPDLGVANLTKNDRTFECYNFKVVKKNLPH